MDESDERDIDSIEESDDSGSDFETQLKSKKRRPPRAALGTPPPKRPQRGAAVQPQSSPLGVSPKNTPPPHSSRNTPRVGREAVRIWGRGRGGQTTAEHLYEAVRSGKSATVTVVDDWLDSYKQDREAALLELINFVVLCCGCKGVVSREMFDTMQNAEIISVLTKEFNEDSVRYPLSASGPQWRRFRAGLCEFVRLLVRRAQNSLLYDEYLFSSLVALLAGLSDSQVRAFRHTSTLIAMKLMTALVEVAVMVFSQTETTHRRYEAERNKELERRAQDRLEELHTTYTELREHQEELQSLMSAVFKGVFVHRYRDRVPEIRAVCMEELGLWLRQHPGAFLTDGHLKYLGWTLHDKQGAVRLQCVRALQGLYREEDFIGRLELFTSRFKERMLCMVLDKDGDVAVEVIQLLLLIQQKTEEGLSEEECARVYPLVYASHRGLACAAGTFLYHRLCGEIQDREKENSRTAFLSLLISFYNQSEFHEHGAYLVDSLWGSAVAELRDWEAMTSLLLREKEQDEGLKDEEEGALIELMVCAVRQAAESRPPVGRAPPGKRILSMKDRKTQAQDRRRLTSHFIVVLPQLLAKYSADEEKVSSLLKVPLHFDLETYSSTGRLEKAVELLLSQVCGIVEKHTEDCVLEACARVACALCAENYAFSARASLAVSQLLDCQADRFTSNLDDLLQGAADEDEVYSAAATLKRIAAFSSARDLTGWQLFDPCLQILKCGVESRDMDKELMLPALKCATCHVLWEKVRFSSSTPTKVSQKRLKQEVKSLCAVCQSCLSIGQGDIRDLAFVLLCDLLLVFRVDSAHTLSYPLDVSLRAELASFLLDYVFTEPADQLNEEDEDEQAKITGLQRRRNQLAGYCKLVIYGVLELSAASDIFKHYSKFFRDYGDIIKETLSKSRIISQTESAKTVCLSLQQLFSEFPQGEGEVLQFGEIRELARRLAMTFGIDLQRVRKALLCLHEDGISFAFRDAGEGDEPPPNLHFLEVLSEFSFKLLRPDRTQLLGFLKRMHPTPPPAWPSLTMYRRSLQGGAREKEEGAADTPLPKRRRTVTEGSSLADRASLDGSSLPSQLPTPPLTSTLLRRRSEPQRDTSDPRSEDDFTDSLLSRRKGRQSTLRHTPSPSPTHSDLDSHLNLLTLIEEDEEEEEEGEEPEIEDFQSEGSDEETRVTLPSTRNSTSYLEGLFE
ncbi:cohesin subunit SA-1 [Megalops cyprinoides]|uniref:cohesin subunit SA-1 n=1 Tax=Megalops cyprinoides TaxID=118141 RepID=UPI00186403F1|nr:cohesin subunit SA-1 [Megalops cyprinoides]